MNFHLTPEQITEMDWFEKGTPVFDMDERSPDAGFILEPEDFDLDWRECSVPLEGFCVTQTTRDEFLRSLPGSYKANLERYETVLTWVSACGGIESALVESPMLVFIDDGELILDDGWHRLGVARFEYGATHARALCTLGNPGSELNLRMSP